MRLDRLSAATLCAVVAIGLAGAGRPAHLDEEEIDRFRAMGPAGVDAFVEEYGDPLEQHPSPAWVREALDRVCAQRDCHSSRLFWYTDLERAKEAARRTARPILSLRLLGNLDQEYSCANSRFFRSALYANHEISDLLRNEFVLHWESVRPVPIVRIDMGDGRYLERTVTGNSVHYVLDATGRPLDALPGLYGPGAFLELLSRARSLWARMEDSSVESAARILRSHHKERLRSIRLVWEAALQGGGEARPSVPIVASLDGQPSGFVDARRAGLVALTKAMVEVPLLEAVLGGLDGLEDESGPELWSRIANAYRGQSRLDAHSTRLLVEKLERRGADRVGPARLERTVRRFEERMAIDSVRNELLLHRRIHEWFARGEGGTDPRPLNDRVYAELFLTPNEDPWLGLVPADTYSALDSDGIAQHGRGRGDDGS